MKKEMSTRKALIILAGLFIASPWVVLGTYKYWSIVYNLLF